MFVFPRRLQNTVRQAVFRRKRNRAPPKGHARAHRNVPVCVSKQSARVEGAKRHHGKAVKSARAERRTPPRREAQKSLREISRRLKGVNDYFLKILVRFLKKAMILQNKPSSFHKPVLPLWFRPHLEHLSEEVDSLPEPAGSAAPQRVQEPFW